MKKKSGYIAVKEFSGVFNHLPIALHSPGQQQSWRRHSLLLAQADIARGSNVDLTLKDYDCLF